MSPCFRLMPCPDAIRFAAHPIIRDKTCIRKPGIGFSYQGRRLLGITEYLRTNFYPSFKAVREKRHGLRVSRNLGLKMGIRADCAVTAYAKTGDQRKMTKNPTACRLLRFLSFLQLHIVDAHVLICEPTYNFATEIDVLCQGPTGLVVIENKTTLQTRPEHERTYRRPDTLCPVLKRGMASLHNSEYNHHQLQLAAMIIMLRNTYGIDATGHVLVASADGINQYPMNPVVLALARSIFAAQAHFRVPPTISHLPMIPYVYRPHQIALPSAPFTTIPLPIDTFLKKRNVTNVTLHTAQGSISYYERPDLTFTPVLDVLAESDDTVYIFLVKAADVAKAITLPSSAPLKGVQKLPSGQKNSLLAACALELAIQCLPLRQKKKKIEARILFLGPKPFFRLVNKTTLAMK